MRFGQGDLFVLGLWSFWAKVGSFMRSLPFHLFHFSCLPSLSLLVLSLDPVGYHPSILSFYFIWFCRFHAVVDNILDLEQFLSVLSFVLAVLSLVLPFIEPNIVPHINSTISLLMALARGNQACPTMFQMDSSWSGMGEGNVSLRWEKYNWPKDVAFHVPKFWDDSLVAKGRDKVCLYKGMFPVGLRLPFPSQMREVLSVLNLSPSQLMPNGWRILLSHCILWPMVLNKGKHCLSDLTAREFLWFNRLGSKGDGFWNLHSCPKRRLINIPIKYSSIKNQE